MRTTLTIDDDLAVLLERLRRERDVSLKQIVNEALRRGLAALERGKQSRPQEYHTRTVSLGKPRLPNLDNVSEALAIAESEGFR
jgi:predicted transcriptional regulator